jgi:hypothetical protein
MGSRSDDCVSWSFFTITVDYNSSHIELLLNDVSYESLPDLRLVSTLSNSQMHCLLYLLGDWDRSHHVLQFLCSAVTEIMS